MKIQTKRARTIVISLPAAFLKAFVQRTFRGFRFILVQPEKPHTACKVHKLT